MLITNCCCYYSIAQSDNFMKVYDVRTLCAQSPVGFSRPPICCRFLHGFDGCVFVSTGVNILVARGCQAKLLQYMLFGVDILNNKTTLFANLTLVSTDAEVAESGQAIAVSCNECKHEANDVSTCLGLQTLLTCSFSSMSWILHSVCTATSLCFLFRCDKL